VVLAKTILLSGHNINQKILIYPIAAAASINLAGQIKERESGLTTKGKQTDSEW
jgi:hypothetical protein